MNNVRNGRLIVALILSVISTVGSIFGVSQLFLSAGQTHPLYIFLDTFKSMTYLPFVILIAGIFGNVLSLLFVNSFNNHNFGYNSKLAKVDIAIAFVGIVLDILFVAVGLFFFVAIYL